jgi:polygalacturonase
MDRDEPTRPMPDHALPRRRFLQASASIAGLGLSRAADAQSGAGPQSAAPGPPDTGLVLNVRDFGAKGDGATKDTSAIQEAIDRCSVLGGGQVLAPAGNYLTGAIALRSNVQLHLDPDAAILGSPDFGDYPVNQVRWEGKWIAGHVGLIYALDASRIAITGPGRIAGNPAVSGRPDAQNPLRHPALIEPIGCRGVLLDGFSTSHHRMWSIHPANCEDIVIRGLTIRSTGGNGDGIDVDSCRRVRIERCDIATGDDCISLKSGRGSEGNALHRPTEDVTISHCAMSDSIFACIGIGSETSGGIRNIRIEHCKFTGARTFAIYIKTRVGRGAFIENIAADDLDVSGTGRGFLSINGLSSGLRDQAPVPGEAGIPQLGNFRFSNIRVADCPVLVDARRIHPDKPLDGFELIGVRGTCARGISLANMRNVDVRDVKVTGFAGPLIGIHNVTGKGIADASPIEPPRLPDAIAAPDRPYGLH